MSAAGGLAACGLRTFFMDFGMFALMEPINQLRVLDQNHIPLKVIHITDREAAQSVPAPVTTYALFRDGRFVTQGIQSDKKFLALAGILP